MFKTSTFLRWHAIAAPRILCLGIALSFSSVTAQEVPPPHQHTRPSPVTFFVLQGDLRHQIDAVINNWLLVAPQRNPQMLGMYRQRDSQPHQNLLPWSGEFAGKYLTACVEVLRISDNAVLRDHTQKFVADLIACQDDDGYIGPFPYQHRLTGTAPNIGGTAGDTWDSWGHYHVMLGLLSWHKLIGDEAALQSACKIADLLDAKFSGADRTILSTRSPEMNQAVIHSLAMLYEVAPQDRYLRLANEIVDEFAMNGAGDYLQSGIKGVDFYKTPKPRWESLHPILGLAELYWITGRTEYRTAVENLWWSIAKFDRHNNGGFSSGEQAQGDPYHSGAIETCCTIAWMALSTAMLHMTDDPRVADELELSLLNQIQALHGPDGSWCTYNTPMDGVRINSTKDIAFQIRPGSEDLNCCSVNAARGFGLTSDWGVLMNDRGATVNYYGASQCTTQFNNTKIQLQQITNYPLENTVRLQFTAERPVQMQCRLRIPHWSLNTSVTINGEDVPAIAGQYLELNRTWNSGDIVEINFDFALRILAGENACSGQVSLYRGPILLALDASSSSMPRYSEHFQKLGDLYASNTADAYVEYDFVGDKITWIGHRFDDAGMARVKIDGKHVATVDQFDRQRGVPFQWTFDQCGFGPHTIRIEGTSDKHESSKGNFINIVDFEPKRHRPKITADALATGSLALSDHSFVLTVTPNEEASLALIPYCDAGRSETPYFTWFAMDNILPVPFIRENPSRTVPLQLQ